MALTGGWGLARRNISALTMGAILHRHPQRASRPGLAWLLWLAMLLPVAHMAALWHGYTHVERAASTASHNDAPAPEQEHCDLCLSAAALGDGAPPITALPVPVVALQQATPMDRGTSDWLPLTTPVYQGRAPPLLPV